jgi:hypothetical protein
MKKEFWHYMENDKIKNFEIKDGKFFKIINNEIPKPNEMQLLEISLSEVWKAPNNLDGLQTLADKIENKITTNPNFQKKFPTKTNSYELARELQRWYIDTFSDEEKKVIEKEYSAHKTHL